jgi:poly-gamma-glutamate synthesis protein (capsule biosynthesis protein)
LFTAKAQEKLQPIIDFKQRYLKYNQSDNPENKTGEDSTRTLRLMIAGNIYQTERHVDYAFNNATGKYNFHNELKYIQPILGLGDITLANLKTNFSGNIKDMHSSPDGFALALKYAGFTALMHANLHTANVDRNTMKRTRDLLLSYDVLHTGAFTDNMQRNGNFPLVINKKGFKIAVLNYGTIGAKPSISKDYIINEIDKTYIERDMRMARANKPDFTIVYFDWGANKQDIPSAVQMEMAQFCFRSGADLVVGTHPNTPMRLDYMSYYDDGVPREGIVAYSLGNLIASNEEVRNRNGYVMDIELKKNNYTGETKLGDWGVIPVFTHYDTTTSGKINVLSVPCSAVENGDILPNLAYIEKRRVINGAYEVRKLLGATADEIQYNLTELAANNVMETIDLTQAPLNNRFNQKRQSELPQAPPPVMPVAVSGSNYPPSLAVIYDDKKPSLKEGANSTLEASQITKNTPNIIKVNPPTTTAVQLTAKDTERANSILQEARMTLNRGNEVLNNSTKRDTANLVMNSASPNVVTNINTAAIPELPKQEKQTSVSSTENKTQTPGVAKQEASSASQQVLNSSTTATNNASNNQPKSAVAVVEDDEQKRKQEATLLEEELRKRKADAALTTDAARQQKIDAELVDDLRKDKTRNSQEWTDAQTTKNKVDTELTSTPIALSKVQPVSKEQDKLVIKTDNNLKLENSASGKISGNMIKAEEKNMSLKFDTSYRVQFYALKKPIPLDTNYYTHLKGYEVIEEEGLFKYMIGRFKTYEECEVYWRNQIQPRYKTSFVVRYIGGRRTLE